MGKVTVEITRKGVFDRKGEPVPVGTKLTLDKEPRGWVNKYRVVSDASGKAPATGKGQGKGQSADETLKAMRDYYKQQTGNDAPGDWDADRIQAELEAASK